MLHARPAEPGDLATIIGMIDEAAGWLWEKDTDQWSTPWPTRAERDGRVKRGIDDRCTWMVLDEAGIVATISCRPDGNPQLWSDHERMEPAVYVSRLIVRRSHGGQGIGHELFDWAGKWAARQYGAAWIRIDVWTTNVALHDYYEKRGFRFLRKRVDPRYPSAALFQKPTASITDSDIPRLRGTPILRKPASGLRLNTEDGRHQH
jgi:GNAT superfamily N-acetyltransferase